jgi:polyhydroxyalkanoate synthesis regulator phasin
MQDAWRAYLEMALGLTEAPRKKAQQVVGKLVSRGGATAAQMQGLAEDLLSTSMANREALTNIVRYEVDRALGVVGLATSEEVGDLTARVRDLEKQLRQAQARVLAAERANPAAASAAAPAAGALDRPIPLPSTPAKKVAKKAVAKKSAAAAKTTRNAMPAAATPARKTAKKAVAKAAPAKPAPTPAKSTPTPAKSSTAKAVAKKTVAKKTVAKKTTGTTPPEVRP